MFASVNIVAAKMTVSTPAKPYHHGNLRHALVEAGLAMIEGTEELSLRAVARRVGVSATAVYRHFPDKGALLTAVATAGLERLASAQRLAFDREGGGAVGFNATGLAYVAFALDHPALFRLIFSRPVGDAMKGHGGSDDAMTFLLANAAALTPPGEDARVFALQAWGVAHGVAMLMLDGQIPRDLDLASRAIDVRAIGWGLGR